MEQTTDNDALIVIFAIAYGGREEISDAVRNLIRSQCRTWARPRRDHRRMSPGAIDEWLYTAGLPDLDLIIRTRGEIRFRVFSFGRAPEASCIFPM
ncbi:undecaprenyl diphosphate synthase family protein [Mesorhizobium sp. WSM3626]|uniref:undecaprenyl diphosphate synthase family protein n=1 Tax=Mesorhizobium sp. WSM3626 TaxID=1040987 RepID=UPI0004AE5CAF|nr:undecaprenyl diphosphate synthase family protein [Mesorhizobium sp. WSM3626]